MGFVDERASASSIVQPEHIVVGRILERREAVKAGVEALHVRAAARQLDRPLDQIHLREWHVLVLRVAESMPCGGEGGAMTLSMTAEPPTVGGTSRLHDLARDALALLTGHPPEVRNRVKFSLLSPITSWKEWVGQRRSRR